MPHEHSTQTSHPPAGELLYGSAAIAAFLGIRQRQAYHLISTGGLPTFKIGDVVCARPDTVRAWIAEREAAGAKAVAHG